MRWPGAALLWTIFRGCMLEVSGDTSELEADLPGLASNIFSFFQFRSEAGPEHLNLKNFVDFDVFGMATVSKRRRNHHFSA